MHHAESQLSAKENRLDSLSHDFHQAQTELEDTRSQLSRVAAHLHQTIPKLQATEHRCNAQERELEHTKSELRERTREREALMRRLEVADPRVAELDALAWSLQQKVAEYEQRFAGVLDIDAEIARLRPELMELDDKRAELRKIEDDLLFADVGLYKRQFGYGDSKAYKEALERQDRLIKQMVKDGSATTGGANWTVSGDKKAGQRLTKDLTKLVLRAFNGECEIAVAKVKWNNFEVLKRRITKAFNDINKIVGRWKIKISAGYRDQWLRELALTHEYKERLEHEKEEQRRLRQQMREEEQALREAEEARRDAEELERTIQARLDAERALLAQARAEEADKFQQHIEELEFELQNAHAATQRAAAMAELTKTGHVYVISNIGSFGENVYKIGMTRRLEPVERIKELGDASVPFLFDIHGMIYTEDAPTLETSLHNEFWHRRLNLVNDRKEFFNVTLNEIQEACTKLKVEVEWSSVAEAKEFRQTLAMRQAGTTEAAVSVES
jgi:chromosome segregation ATPase